MPKTKQNNYKQRSRSGVNQTKNKKLNFLLGSKRKPLLSVLVILVISVVGASVLVFSQAAPNNCQKQDGVPICDVDQVAGNSDTILSRGSEAQELGKKGWGVYYGTVFRAPAHAYKKAVPITRVHNAEASYHDWVTPKQKSTKEAKYKGKVKSGGVAFYAWTKDTRPGGTVPVYRLTRAGNHTQPIFSTDGAWVQRVLAQDKGKANGWKRDDLAPYVAFYAYKPNYQVVNKDGDKTVSTPNPYDCSIEANFISDRCKTQRENLQTEINKGNVPKDNSCPKTLGAYLKVPLPGELEKNCRDFWNEYMKDCSQQENYITDRCTAEREAIAKAQLEQIRRKREAAQVFAGSGYSPYGGSSSSNRGSGSGSGSSNRSTSSADPSIAGYYKLREAVRLRCASIGYGVNAITLKCDGKRKPQQGVDRIGSSAKRLRNYQCVIKGEVEKSNGRRNTKNKTLYYRISRYNLSDARAACTKIKSSLNASNQWKNMKVSQVYQIK